jgi:multicomponent Na+:H+ antiporter subunit A
MTSPILQTAGRTLFHTLLVFSLFMLFAGHNNPGGGFIGGLVAGAALVLRYLAEGSDDLRRLVPVPTATLLGAGLVCASVAGVIGPLSGQGVLSSASLDATLPLFGDVHLTTVMLFDTGVYLVVIGVVHGILDTLGAEAER